MDLVLEALKRMAEYRFEEYGVERDDGTSFDEDFEIIKQALLELKAIKEANPSEALECLENIRKDIYDYYNEYLDDISIIKQALLKAQEQEKEIEILKEYRKDYLSRLENLEKCSLNQEKVLKVIFEKKVNIGVLESVRTYREYNNRILDLNPTLATSLYFLIEEEFDLLKKNLIF